MPPPVAVVTVGPMATLNAAPSDFHPTSADQFDNLLELSGEITEITEFYLGVLAVQPAIACQRCGGSAAAPADLTAAREALVSSDLLTYLCAVAHIDDSIDWEPDELLAPPRRAQVDQVLKASGMEPLTGIEDLAAVVADIVERSGAELLSDAWCDRWPGLLIPGEPCTCEHLEDVMASR